jgi:hypothetical protein
MLAVVVKNRQRLLSLEHANEVLDPIALARKFEVECLRDGGRDVVAAGQRASSMNHTPPLKASTNFAAIRISAALAA